MYWIISLKDNTYTYSDESQQGKFVQDTWWVETENYISASYGVILNLDDLKKEAGQHNVFEFLYCKYAQDFPNYLRGSFAGVFLDKRTGMWTIFTNHTGDRKLFYSIYNETLLLSDSIFSLQKQLKKIHQNVSLNLNAAYSILSYSHLFGSETLLNQISRLTAGKSLQADISGIREHKYYQINNRPDYSLKDRDVVEELDSLFRESVNLEYKKDQSCNFPHFASLSGGLDSRMTVWVAEQLGYKHQLLYTFAQTGYADMILAKNIAEDLGRPWQFIPLDGGDYLKEIDFIVKYSEGLVGYSGPSTAYTSHNKMDLSPYGMMHSGQLGDVVLASYNYNNKAYSEEIDPSVLQLSSRFSGKVNLPLQDFSNNETFYFESRGLNGILCGNFSIQQSNEVSSPFLYPELMDLMFRVPIEKRSRHQLYRKWILQKYPEAAHYKWEEIDARLSVPVFGYKKFQIPYYRLPKMVMQKVRKMVGQNPSRHGKGKSMNPFEYWYQSNQSLKQFVDDYYNNYLDLIPDAGLKSDCSEIFHSGRFVEKLQVLTLLSFLKQLEN